MDAALGALEEPEKSGKVFSKDDSTDDRHKQMNRGRACIFFRFTFCSQPALTKAQTQAAEELAKEAGKQTGAKATDDRHKQMNRGIFGELVKIFAKEGAKEVGKQTGAKAVDAIVGDEE